MTPGLALSTLSAAAAAMLAVLPSRPRRPLAIVAGIVLVAALIVQQWGPGLTSYDSDLWTYALVIDRVASGTDVLAVEPFRLLPPPSPHVSLLWIALGRLRAWTGADPIAMVRALGVLAAFLLTVAALRVAGSHAGERARPAAVGLFWLALAAQWEVLGLGRNLALAFWLLALADLPFRGDPTRKTWRLALWIGLAFAIHPFVGILAAVHVLLASSVSGAAGRPVVWGRVCLATLLGAMLAMPTAIAAVASLGMEKTAAHVWRPEQEAGFLDPRVLLNVWPWPLTLLAAVGLVWPRDASATRLRALVAAGALVVGVLLFTPALALVTGAVGAWMAVRILHLLLPWLPAALVLDGLLAHPRAVLRGVGLVAAATVAAVAFRDASAAIAPDANPPFVAAARAEAAALRPLLRDHVFVSADLLAYGLAGTTSGRPLGVPPGHASPYGDFRREHRRVKRALEESTPGCWAALLSLYPQIEMLVTPGTSALTENELWRTRVGEDPERARVALAAVATLAPLHVGRYFRVDAVHAPPSTAGAAMGHGAECR